MRTGREYSSRPTRQTSEGSYGPGKYHLVSNHRRESILHLLGDCEERREGVVIMIDPLRLLVRLLLVRLDDFVGLVCEPRSSHLCRARYVVGGGVCMLGYVRVLGDQYCLAGINEEGRRTSR